MGTLFSGSKGTGENRTNRPEPPGTAPDFPVQPGKTGIENKPELLNRPDNRVPIPAFKCIKQLRIKSSIVRPSPQLCSYVNETEESSPMIRLKFLSGNLLCPGRGCLLVIIGAFAHP